MIVWIFKGESVPVNLSVLALRLEQYSEVKEFLLHNDFFFLFIIIRYFFFKGTPGNVLISSISPQHGKKKADRILKEQYQVK